VQGQLPAHLADADQAGAPGSVCLADRRQQHGFMDFGQPQFEDGSGSSASSAGAELIPTSKASSHSASRWPITGHRLSPEARRCFKWMTQG